MSDSGDELSAVQVCVRVRPLNPRERDEGQRRCVYFDQPSKQVVLSAVDKSTLLHLKGQINRGYAFDKRYGQEHTSKEIYNDSIRSLVDNIFKGFNGTVLAYGQTGSGKTHTMSGGVGAYGTAEDGIIPQAIHHLFELVDVVKRKLKSGEAIEIRATALEIYNEDLKDLSPVGAASNNKVKLQERPTGPQGRVVAELGGLHEVTVHDAAALLDFFKQCDSSRSTTATKLNDRSSRSHAIFTITVHRTIIEILEQLDESLNAKVVTQQATSKLHLVDLAGSERVKRSGVSGAALKEASHINQGLLSLGNVIVALADQSESGRVSHVPYRSSKLTRLLQDSLGGNSLTTLIACISPAEGDFEETNNALKYANRACSIKNSPLANKSVLLEEDLLPMLPTSNGGGLNMAMMLESHVQQREIRERRDKEKQEKERKRQEQLKALKASKMRAPGYQRLLAQEYDRKLQDARRNGVTEFAINSTIEGDKVKLRERPPTGSAQSPAPRMPARSPKAPSSRSRPGTGRKAPGTPGGGAFNFNEFVASRKADPVSPAGRSEVPPSAISAAEDDPYSPGRSDAAGTPPVAPAAHPRADSLDSLDSLDEAPTRPVAADPHADDPSPAAPAGGASDGGDAPEGAVAPAAAAAPTEPWQQQPQAAEDMDKDATSGDGHEQPESEGEEGDAPDSGARAAPRERVAVEDFGEEDSPRAGADRPSRAQARMRETVALGDDMHDAQLADHIMEEGALGEAGGLQASHDYGEALPDDDMHAGHGHVEAEAEGVDMAVGKRGVASAMGGDAMQPHDLDGSRAEQALADRAAKAAQESAEAAIQAEAELELAEQEAAHAAEEAATRAQKGAMEEDDGGAGVGYAGARAAEEVEEEDEDEDGGGVGGAAGPGAEPVGEESAVDPKPKLLARFKVNKFDAISVFKAVTREDFKDVVSLLPENTPLPASDKMTYLIARLELVPSASIIDRILEVEEGAKTMKQAVGPAVGCLMATFGTNMISSCIFDFDDPEALELFNVDERIELWGLQIPHNSARPALEEQQFDPNMTAEEIEDMKAEVETETAIIWTSIDRLNMSVGLLHALCVHANELYVRCGFCVPRPQLLRRWQQAGVKMRPVETEMRLIYPDHAHDYDYYKSSTVAFFLVDEVTQYLTRVLSLLEIE